MSQVALVPLWPQASESTVFPEPLMLMPPLVTSEPTLPPPAPKYVTAGHAELIANPTPPSPPIGIVSVIVLTEEVVTSGVVVVVSPPGVISVEVPPGFVENVVVSEPVDVTVTPSLVVPSMTETLVCASALATACAEILNGPKPNAFAKIGGSVSVTRTWIRSFDPLYGVW
jgi:hypothetical protein